MNNLNLQCKCGSVKGTTQNITPKLGNRIICYCDDCQAFATHLGDTDSILDEHGGTDIFQLPISHVKITEGTEHIRCLRLTPKGLYRWYTDCCKTPIGNTLNAKMPFIGIIHNFIDSEDKEKDIGPVIGVVQTKFAKDRLTKNLSHISERRTFYRVVFKLITWKFKGYNKPNAFFENDGRAISKPRIISTEN